MVFTMRFVEMHRGILGLNVYYEDLKFSQQWWMQNRRKYTLKQFPIDEGDPEFDLTPLDITISTF